MKLRNRQFGQGMTEYIIIVALIAVAGIIIALRSTTPVQLRGPNVPE